MSLFCKLTHELSAPSFFGIIGTCSGHLLWPVFQGMPGPLPLGRGGVNTPISSCYIPSLGNISMFTTPRERQRKWQSQQMFCRQGHGPVKTGNNIPCPAQVHVIEEPAGIIMKIEICIEGIRSHYSRRGKCTENISKGEEQSFLLKMNFGGKGMRVATGAAEGGRRGWTRGDESAMIGKDSLFTAAERGIQRGNCHTSAHYVIS